MMERMKGSWNILCPFSFSCPLSPFYTISIFLPLSTDFFSSTFYMFLSTRTLRQNTFFLQLVFLFSTFSFPFFLLFLLLHHSTPFSSSLFSSIYLFNIRYKIYKWKKEVGRLCLCIVVGIVILSRLPTLSPFFLSILLFPSLLVNFKELSAQSFFCPAFIAQFTNNFIVTLFLLPTKVKAARLQSKCCLVLHLCESLAEGFHKINSYTMNSLNCAGFCI